MLDRAKLRTIYNRHWKSKIGLQNAARHDKANDDALDYRDLDIFHRAVYPILIIGQCFAIMPVAGVSKPNPKHLRFSLKSLQFLVTVSFLAAGLTLIVSSAKDLLKVGINPKNSVGLVFFLSAESACILFLSMASRWPEIIRYWTRTEMIFLLRPYPIPKRKLAARVRLAACVIILLSFVEHGLFFISSIWSYNQYLQICHRNDTSFSTYMKGSYKYVFEILPYSNLTAITVLIVNGIFTFIWNYMDLFIMVISKSIAYRFEQITARINKLTDKEIPENVFTEIREHYVKLCELVEYIDDSCSGIILLSSMNNLYFVCLQMLNIFSKLRWVINSIYFWFSLLYLVGRTTFVFLNAASINDESKASLNALRVIAPRSWSTEVERLVFQMTTQTVALSGKKFYFLTRRLLFGMAATIVSYELVLLQFDEPTRVKGLPNLC